ncbi:MAG TPA: HEAT repeat domain-containing protein [Acidobacteriaceae bacterium]|nr:HEAT repeat domain-containing protein [Acidobacteriaceae bacterium]
MNCDRAQEDIVLAVYGELPDDRAHQLEQHLLVCERCLQEMEAVSALSKAMSLLPMEEPSPSLLARTRVRLDEALDAIPHGGFFVRRWQSFRRGFGRLQSAPAMASAVLLVGLGAGGWGGYHFGRSAEAARGQQVVAQSPAPAVPVLADVDPSQVADVSSIIQEPGTENVEVRFARVVPETVFGTLDDPQIRQLLLVAAHNRANAATHDDSVDLLARECRAGHECNGGPIRNALMVALRYDKDATVRRKALEGLQPYIGVDNRVRDAVLEALLNDPDAQIRSEAIGLLAPVEADSSVREVLQTVASQDQNPYIRNVSRQFLEQVSQIQ